MLLQLLYSDSLQSRWRAISVISNVLAGSVTSIDAVMVAVGGAANAADTLSAV